jgi:LCP family protein required for cell wall assembly
MDTTQAGDLVEPGSTDGESTDQPAPVSRKARRQGRHGRKRRWPKRLAIALVSVVVLIAAAIGLTYGYATHKLGEFHHVVVQHLTPPPPPGKPFNVLLVGSDSRKFVDTPAEEKQFGNPADQTGQRSDVIIIALFIPASKRIILLSIPRDTYVDIPGNVPNVSGPNRINVAFDTGSPSLLIKTIEEVFGIPITHYVAVNFEGFSDMVNALGGVYLRFPVPVKDTVSDLDVTKTGCQLVDGTVALALVRSRDLQYETSSGWQYDVQGDFSRIRRQDAFFQSLISKANGASPFTLNGFLSAAQKNENVSIDQNWSGSALLSLGNQFKGITGKDLITETIPETEGVVDGQDILYAAQPYARDMVAGFLEQGASSALPAPHHSTSTTAPATHTTTTPTTAAPPTTTTIPYNVVTNTEPEPWNPVPC